MNTFLSPLSEKQSKDEYGTRGAQPATCPARAVDHGHVAPRSSMGIIHLCSRHVLHLCTASHGYLDASARTKLLAQWSSKQKVKSQIEEAKSELERLQKAREETASSPRDQRYMPSDIGEAIMLASQDEEEAEAARVSSRKQPRLRTTPKRNCTLNSADLASPITKQRISSA